MSNEDFTTLSSISPGLSNENLSKALSKWFNKNMTFTHWEYVGDTGKGDSYLSEVIRIKIIGKDNSDEENHVQVLLKNIPKSLSRKLTFRCDEFFKNEINFYEHVLPSLLQFQSTKKVSDPFLNYAKLFYSYCDGENDFIILEDATIHSFGAAVRQQGIDLAHAEMTLKTFAKFHAMSFAMRDQKPEEFARICNKIEEQYYHERLWGWYQRFWARLCRVAIDAVEKEYPNSIYLEKLKSFAVPATFERACKAVKDTENGVISHGDSWTNNFLYKYVNGRIPSDAKMIDFQLTRCASPVLDISFFIYACTMKPLRDSHYEYLLKYYYELLAKQIRELGSEPETLYSWNTFMEEVKNYSFFGLAFSFESIPFIILDPEDAFNMEMKGDKKLNIEEVWPVPPIKTKEGRLREADNIVHAVDNGYI